MTQDPTNVYKILTRFVSCDLQLACSSSKPVKCYNYNQMCMTVVIYHIFIMVYLWCWNQYWIWIFQSISSIFAILQLCRIVKVCIRNFANLHWILEQNNLFKGGSISEGIGNKNKNHYTVVWSVYNFYRQKLWFFFLPALSIISICKSFIL